MPYILEKDSAIGTAKWVLADARLAVTNRKTIEGLRLDWVDVDTVRVQPGYCVADDGETILEVTDTAGSLDITFADLDTGSRTEDVGYYVWLHDNSGTLEGVLSTSATAPTGKTGGKRLIGWIWNADDGGAGDGNIARFYTRAQGTELDYQWLTDPVGSQRRVLEQTAPQPTTMTQVNCATPGAVPGSYCAAIRMTVIKFDDYGVYISDRSSTGDEQVLLFGQGFGTSDINTQVLLVTNGGTSIWFRNDGTSSGDSLYFVVDAFIFDRSGYTYA